MRAMLKAVMFAAVALCGAMRDGRAGGGERRGAAVAEDGRVWSFRVTSEKRPTVSVDLLTPLPGFVATDPARLAVFEE